MEKITLTIDLEDDFDGIELELAIKETTNTHYAQKILTRLHHLWVTEIGHPEMSHEKPD